MEWLEIILTMNRSRQISRMAVCGAGMCVGKRRVVG